MRALVAPRGLRRRGRGATPLEVPSVPERTCTIPDCNDPHWARGYCGKHYQRWAKHGTPLPYTMQPPTDGEQWLPVVGYEGLYEVSDLGRVRRVAEGPGTWAGRVLRDVLAGKGYRAVELYRSGKHRRRYIHQIVLDAFVGPCPAGQEVNHKDGDKTHNRPGNLEYVTQLGNSQHASRTGLMRHSERHPHTKLTAEQVAEIRRLYRPRIYSTHRLAREFGVCAQTIHNIITGKVWSQ